MRFFVYTKAGSSQEKIEEIDENHFIVWTRMPAKEDKANNAVIKILANHLKVSPSQLKLTEGRHYKEKTFELN